MSEAFVVTDKVTMEVGNLENLVYAKHKPWTPLHMKNKSRTNEVCSVRKRSFAFFSNKRVDDYKLSTLRFICDKTFRPLPHPEGFPRKVFFEKKTLLQTQNTSLLRL